MQQGASHRATKETDISRSLATILPSGKEAYAIPNQGPSTAGYQFCAASKYRRSYIVTVAVTQVPSDLGEFPTSGSEQDAHHTPLLLYIGRHGRALHQNGRGAPTKERTSHQRDWDAILLIFLLAYRACIHGTTA
jgi:hypothetical protein